MFITLCFQTYWPKWLNFFGHFKNILAYDRQITEKKQLRAGVEQPFDCLIVQNRHAVQSTRRSVGWTLEDNMVDGLFFCVTLKGRWRGHTPFVQAGAEVSEGEEAVKLDPRCSWQGHSGRVGAGVGNESTESRKVVQPLRLHLVIRPVRRTYVVAVRWTDELLCGEHKW